MIGLSTTSAKLPAGATTPADEAAVQAVHGMLLDDAAKMLLDQFDDDGDGSIYDQKTFGLRLGSEAKTSTTEITYTLGLLVGQPRHDFVRVRHTTPWTINRLMARADTNADRIATRAEIAAVVTSYDADGDGRLSTTELQRLRAEVGAERGRTWRWVDPVVRRRDR